MARCILKVQGSHINHRLLILTTHNQFPTLTFPLLKTSPSKPINHAEPRHPSNLHPPIPPHPHNTSRYRLQRRRNILLPKRRPRLLRAPKQGHRPRRRARGQLNATVQPQQPQQQPPVRTQSEGLERRPPCHERDRIHRRHVSRMPREIRSRSQSRGVQCVGQPQYRQDQDILGICGASHAEDRTVRWGGAWKEGRGSSEGHFKSRSRRITRGAVKRYYRVGWSC